MCFFAQCKQQIMNPLYTLHGTLKYDIPFLIQQVPLKKSLIKHYRKLRFRWFYIFIFSSNFVVHLIQCRRKCNVRHSQHNIYISVSWDIHSFYLLVFYGLWWLLRVISSTPHLQKFNLYMYVSFSRTRKLLPLKQYTLSYFTTAHLTVPFHFLYSHTASQCK